MGARIFRSVTNSTARAWLPAALALIAGQWHLAPAWADDDLAQKQHQLDALRGRMAAIQKDISDKQGKKSSAETAVREVERDIGKALAGIRKIDGRLGELHADLNRLQSQRVERQTALEAQRARLLREVRAAYAMGRQRQVKLLLNQEQPSLMGRTLTYFRYIGKARAAAIEETRNSLRALHELEDDIQTKTSELDAARSQQEAERRILESRMRERQQVVDRLARELADRGTSLAQMQSDEESLMQLINKLMQALADIPPPAASSPALSAGKGKFGWPARGKLAQRFGDRLGRVGLTSRGVFIETREGNGIRAISAGRVVYADWLRGFGLLLILDHGNGFMSLYGHNQAIYKDVGERVADGEVIAAAGRSGGYSTPGVYFELRSKGRPVDPLAWCAGRPDKG